MEILLSTKEIKDILKKHCEEHFGRLNYRVIDIRDRDHGPFNEILVIMGNCEKPFMLIKDE